MAFLYKYLKMIPLLKNINPLYLLISFFCFIGGIVILIILLKIIAFLIFKKRLKSVHKDNSLAQLLILSKYSSKKLYKRSSSIEKFSLKFDKNIIYLLNMDKIWFTALIKKKNKQNLVRVLKYAEDHGIFDCFLLCLKKKKYMPIFLDWFNNKNDVTFIRRIALKSENDDFDKKITYDFLSGKITDIRELTGDPEWVSRYFAVNLLLFDNNEKSVKLIWELLDDSNYKVRKLIINKFNPEESERFYKKLFYIFKNDPIFEVRKSAAFRIFSDYSSSFKISEDNINDKEIFHLLGLLRENSKEDENFAMKFIAHPNLELRFMACNFLNNCGSLERLCTEVNLGDKENLERNYNLLLKASEVNVSGFLNCIEKTDNPATLILCAKILSEKGDKNYIFILARKVFSLIRSSGSKLEGNFLELYELTLKCISNRGNEKTLKLMDYELNRRQYEDKFVPLLIKYIPKSADHIFYNTLIKFLKDPEFKHKETLNIPLLKMPVSIILPELFNIIKDETGFISHSVKVDSLLLLTKMNMPYCLQFILENLYYVEPDKAKDFALVLKNYPKKDFIKKVEDLLSLNDAKTRAGIISILPATEMKEFVKTIIKSLKDSDPDVRIACTMSIVGFKEFDSLDYIVEMLRDPVERVRCSAGMVLGWNGSKKILKEMDRVLNDENEVIDVKKAVVYGLGHSNLIESVDILVKALEFYDELEKAIQIALTVKKKKDQIKKIITHFKSASPKLKHKISETFKLMDEDGEDLLLDLLDENIVSLKDYIVEILESNGFIERCLRKISHKDRQVRKETADILSKIGSKSAYRGIVMASRDPDNDVRIMVIKALEKLESIDGNKILEALKKDPDKRVRKYTLWALERLKAKAL